MRKEQVAQWRWAVKARDSAEVVARLTPILGGLRETTVEVARMLEQLSDTPGGGVETAVADARRDLAAVVELQDEIQRAALRFLMDISTLRARG